MSAVASVLCVGEAMVVGAPSGGGSLATAAGVDLHVAGAEANVACGLAARGVPVEWWSRLGTDPFGERVLHELVSRSVDCSAVVRDARRPTGMYLKDQRPEGTAVHYYRAGSAASAMSADDVGLLRLTDRRLVHLTGITPALSRSCDTLVERIVDDRGTTTLSFDVNHRPALWPDRATASARLLELACRSDVVFVGRDEAAALWGTSDALSVRELLPHPRVLVVKDADVEATAVVRTAGADTVTVVAAPAVDVVEPVGAGDAFAAGFLGSWLADRAAEVALRSGHAAAGHALRTTADVPGVQDVTDVHGGPGAPDGSSAPRERTR